MFSRMINRALTRFFMTASGVLFGWLVGLVVLGISSAIIPIVTTSALPIIITVAVCGSVGGVLAFFIPLSRRTPVPVRPAANEEAFNPVVENAVNGIDEAEEMQANLARQNALIRSIHADNNNLLANLCEEKTDLLSPQEIIICKEMIAALDGDSKLEAEQQLTHYEAYIAEPCILDSKLKHDVNFNPLTIVGNYSAEGQPADRYWAATYHFEDFQKYIESCNQENRPALAPHTRDLLNDPLHITIYKGFLTTIVTFIRNVRHAIQQRQIDKEPELTKTQVRTARLKFYGKLFAKPTVTSNPVAPNHSNLSPRS